VLEAVSMENTDLDILDKVVIKDIPSGSVYGFYSGTIKEAKKCLKKVCGKIEKYIIFKQCDWYTKLIKK
jgi:hypothetical protein